MPKVPAKHVKNARKLIDLAGEDSVPVEGTAGKQLACQVLQLVVNHADECGDADMPSADARYFGILVETAETMLRQKTRQRKQPA